VAPKRFRAELRRVVGDAVRDERRDRPGDRRTYRGLAGIAARRRTADAPRAS
jgi:hypothetical protein